MSSFQIPSNNAASDGSLLAVTLDTLRAFVRDELDDCLPCRVEAVNGNMVDVKILPLLIMTDGTTLARPIVYAVPIAWPGGSSGLLRFKIQPGALGLLKATDRDLTLVLQTMAEAKPNTMRRHSFSDSFFLPNDFGAFTSAGAGDVVVQTKGGDAYVSVSSGSVDAVVGGSSISVTDSSFSAAVGSATIELTDSAFTATIAGVPMTYDGVGLKIGVIDIGPLHAHTSTAPGSPTGPVLP